MTSYSVPTTYSNPFHSTNSLQSWNQYPERSCLLNEKYDLKRPMKRKHCRNWDEGTSEASPSKRFISEEEVSNSIQELNISNPQPPSSHPPPNIPALRTTHQLNITAVSSCQSSLQHKRERKLSDSNIDLNPVHKRSSLKRKFLEHDLETFVEEKSDGGTKCAGGDHLIHRGDHVTNYDSHMMIPQEETTTNLTQSQTTYPTQLVSSQTFNVESTSPQPSLESTTPFTQDWELSAPQDYPSTCSTLHKHTDDDDDDDDVNMADNTLEKSAGDTESTCPPRSSLSLSDVLKKMGRGVTLEDLSSDSDGGMDGPEKPLSLWIAPELQQHLSKNSQSDSLLPPSILEEVTKPRGMELVPWVEPGRHTAKIHKDSSEDTTKEDKSYREAINVLQTDSFQNMESVGESQGLLEYDEDESEMDQTS